MNMKLVWRRGASALIVILALAATLLVPATAEAQQDDAPQDCTFHVFHGEEECDGVRIDRVIEMLVAIQSYAADTGTFRVDGGGFRGRGTGWAYWEREGSRNYPTSIATVLINKGYLSADSAPDADARWSRNNDVMVYRCQDRVAVFATGVTEEPNPVSRDWWADNDCTRYPIDRVGATYFVISVPLSLTGSLNTEAEQVRVQAVSDMVAALESYGAANGTYRVGGGGFRGGGTGWTYWEKAGSTYPVAIATVLSNEGHLPANAARDPLWSSSTAIEGDLMTYRCKDRVAVFTRHAFAEPYGPTETSAFDSGWWADNGCTRYPLDRFNATYFKLSAPLP